MCERNHVFEGYEGQFVKDVVDLTDDPKGWSDTCTCENCGWEGPMSETIIGEMKIVNEVNCGTVVCPECKFNI